MTDKPSLIDRLNKGVVIGAEACQRLEQDGAEMADFARRFQQIGVNYIGTCYGAGPHHVRAIAEALGPTVPASRYSPDLSQHAMLGKEVHDHDKPFMSHWKDEE